MQLFYDPNLQPGTHELREVEARHAVQVLRKRVGDVLDLIDGKGGWFKGEIMATGKKTCTLSVSLVRREEKRANHRLTIAIAPTKAGERYEWFLEKATEIGIDAIQPLVTEHSERRKIRPDRLEKVLESAMKQSLQAWLPELLPLKSFSDFVSTDDTEVRLIGWIDDTVNSPLKNNYQPGQNVSILIGPEGGFSDREAENAKSRGYLPVSLGLNRLRTETAGVVAAQLVADLNFNAAFSSNFATLKSKP